MHNHYTELHACRTEAFIMASKKVHLEMMKIDPIKFATSVCNIAISLESPRQISQWPNKRLNYVIGVIQSWK